MTAPVRHERVIAESDGTGWLVMWPTGDVEHFADKNAVLRSIRHRVKANEVLVSQIEWRTHSIHVEKAE